MTAVFDTRGGGNQPLWLCAVLALPRNANASALVAVQPTSDVMWGAMYDRMARTRFMPVTPHQWATGAWGLSHTAAIDVVAGELVRFTTGVSSVYCGPGMDVTPGWLDAVHRHGDVALLALLLPDTLGDDEPIEEKQAALAKLADNRQLLGTTARVRFDMPVRRPT